MNSHPAERRRQIANVLRLQFWDQWPSHATENLATPTSFMRKQEHAKFLLTLVLITKPLTFLHRVWRDMMRKERTAGRNNINVFLVNGITIFRVRCNSKSS